MSRKNDGSGAVFSQSPNAPLTSTDDLNFKKNRNRKLLLISLPIILLLIIIIIVLILSKSSSSNSDSKNTLSISEPRQEFIDTLIKELPSRSSTSLDEMCNEMKKLKSKNDLNEAETAWFIFKWISENIQYDCYGVKHGGGDQYSGSTYSTGKGVCAGFSSLYKYIATKLGLEAEYLTGHEKSGVTPGGKPSAANHAWNIVTIDGNQYFIDVTFGTGMCVGESFVKAFVPYFFCPPPQEFIHTHYPLEEKYQLLDDPVDFDTWSEYTNLYAYFFTQGFNKVEPEKSLYQTNGEQNVKFYYNKTIEGMSVRGTLYFYDYSAGAVTTEDKSLVSYIDSEGCTEIKITLPKKGKYEFRANSYQTVTVDRTTTISSKYIGTLTFQNS